MYAFAQITKLAFRESEDPLHTRAESIQRRLAVIRIDQQNHVNLWMAEMNVMNDSQVAAPKLRATVRIDQHDINRARPDRAQQFVGIQLAQNHAEFRTTPQSVAYQLRTHGIGVGQ